MRILLTIAIALCVPEFIFAIMVVNGSKLGDCIALAFLLLLIIQ